MLTVCAGLFLRLTRTTNDDVPLGLLLLLIVLFDGMIALLCFAMLTDGPLVPLVHLIVQGLCR